jgi:hypothetical protein
MQPPFKVDQLQIQPGSPGFRGLQMAPDGNLLFVDPAFPNGLELAQIATGATPNVFVVGPGGSGAQYNTIQSALDAVPSTSSPTNPYVIVIAPGVYHENLNLIRDGVTLMAWSSDTVNITPLQTAHNGSGATNTLTIQAGGGTVPTSCQLIGLFITNPHDGYACVRVIGGGASTVLSTGLTIIGGALAATSDIGYAVWGTASGPVNCEGVVFTGSGGVLLQNMSFSTDKGNLPPVSAVFDSTGTLFPVPSGTTAFFLSANGSYVPSGFSQNPYIAVAVSANGGASFSKCDMGDVNVSLTASTSSGNFRLASCTLGNLTVAGPVSVDLIGTSMYGTISGSGGVALANTRQKGTVTFSSSSSQSVTLPLPFANSAYSVRLEMGNSVASVPGVTSKSTSGFTIVFGSGVSVPISWIADDTI